MLDADKFDRSQVRYAVGADLRLLDWLTPNTDFLGRSDIVRPDTVTMCCRFPRGLEVGPLQRVIVFLNALLPLNHEGLHDDYVLACGVERVF